MLTAPGLGSGLDIGGLVDQLVAAERQAPEARLNRAETTAQTRLSAFGLVQSAISGFRSSITQLSKLSTFGQLGSSSSDADSVSISAGSTATPGNYNVEVSQLASQHSLASTAFTDPDTTTVGSGSLTIRFGTTVYDAGTDAYSSFTLNDERTEINLTIDSSNNTLQGIRDAINAENAGVSASIVNDGSGYRLLLSSDQTGAENSLEISVTDDDTFNEDNAGLSRLAFNSGATHVEQTAAAIDAAFTLNGLAITSASNKVDSALDGVTLNLQKVTTDPVQLSITRNLKGIEGAIRSFANEYNKLHANFESLGSYDADTQRAGIMLGDFTFNAIQGRVDSIMRSQVSGLTANMQSLSALGITTQEDGSLGVDGDVLSKALEDNLSDVTALFASVGQNTNGDVSYISSGDDTQVGNYAINITQLAAAGNYAGTGVLPDFGGGSTLAIDANNDSFTIAVDGIDAGSISLTQATYTSGAALAAEVQVQINSATALKDAGVAVTVAYDNTTNKLTITSDGLGSDSSVEFTAVDTNTASSLGFAIGLGTAGLDVAGTINGEAATGTGQSLKADTGTAADGMVLVIGGTTLGNRGSVNFTRGLVSNLDAMINNFLVEDGLLDSRQDGLRSTIEDIGEKRVALDKRIEAIEARFLRQFNALDLLLQQLQSTSAYLDTQLANLPKPGLLLNR